MDMMLKEGLQNKFKIIIYLTLSIIFSKITSTDIVI